MKQFVFFFIIVFSPFWVLAQEDDVKTLFINIEKSNTIRLLKELNDKVSAERNNIQRLLIEGNMSDSISIVLQNKFQTSIKKFNGIVDNILSDLSDSARRRYVINDSSMYRKVIKNDIEGFVEYYNYHFITFAKRFFYPKTIELLLLNSRIEDVDIIKSYVLFDSSLCKVPKKDIARLLTNRLILSWEINK